MANQLSLKGVYTNNRGYDGRKWQECRALSVDSAFPMIEEEEKEEEGRRAMCLAVPSLREDEEYVRRLNVALGFARGKVEERTR